jgi:acyl-CoA synthetase (AMP-forming)/AMP-acid ligase II
LSTLTEVLERGLHDANAVVIPGGPTLSYGKLSAEVERISEELTAQGVVPGRAVSIILPNSLEFVTIFLAVARTGAISAPLNSAYTQDEFNFFMEDANAQLAIISTENDAARDAAEALAIPILTASSDVSGDTHLFYGGSKLSKREPAKLPSADDTALFLHTSGTTSRPKGVPLTHANLGASLKNIRDTYNLTSDDIAMVVMPLFHVHGLIGVTLSTFSSGGSIVVPDRFSATNFWEIQAATGSTWYSAVPTIHQILLLRADEDNAPQKSFRFIRSCSSALAPSVFEKLEERFGAPVLEAYGMTEASHQMSSSPFDDRRAGTVGKGTGVDIAIMADDGVLLPPGQIGEVVINGPNVTHGYANNQDANKEAFAHGWFHTGDQGQMSDDGYLSLTGRLKELINRAGEKISPLEVDGILLKHPAVNEAVCFAAPDEKYGEVVHAAVVLGGETTAEEIMAHCRTQMAEFKVPEVIYFAESLPRTATGKIQRRHVATAFLSD